MSGDMKTRRPSRSNHGRRASAGLILDGEDILRWIKATPDPALQELSERLDEVHQVIAPTSTINDWFRARKISFLKKPPTPVNRNARMGRQHAWFGANVRPGSRPIEAAGATLLYLPPYSPDCNPIEMAFAKLKALLRKAAARTVDGLWDAIAEAIDAFTSTECENYFAAAGYDRD